MVQLYRIIRQKLLHQNKFQKYILYAVGEILLVVIGILLALQFNNWSQENSNKKKQDWYLINIVEDIEYQKQELKYQKSRLENCIIASESILRHYKKTKSFEGIDSLNFKLNLLMEVDNFPNINNTYQELVSSGQQALIKNKDLSIDIIDYYLYSEDNEIDIKNNNENVFYTELHPLFYELSQIILIDNDLYNDDEGLFEIEEDIDKILLNKLENETTKMKFLNALKEIIIIHNIHLITIEETLTLGKNLVQKIDEELGLTPDMVNPS